MELLRGYWPEWTKTLQKLGLAEFVVWALEVAGPLNIVGAQMLYISEPFFSSNSSQSLNALATLLEQEDEARAFIDLLKGNAS
jgi:hypothetical protein